MVFIKVNVKNVNIGAGGMLKFHFFGLLLCLCLTSHQQLRSYGDGAAA